MAYSLVQLGYISRATRLMSDIELDRLLLRARESNNNNEITGMLLYVDGSFLQIIEGDQKNIQDTFRRIRRSSQHEDIKILFNEAMKERSFVDWSMGFKRLTADIVQTIPGFTEVLERQHLIDQHMISHSSKAQKLKDIMLYFKTAA